MDDNIVDIVSSHKQALITSGNISDFQIINLQKYPFVAYQAMGLKEVKIAYNFLNKEGLVCAGKVSYTLTLENKDPKKRKESLKLLHQFVKDLFWQETKVLVKIKSV